VADARTKADPAAKGWMIDDPVVRFRHFGSEQVIDLAASDRWGLGSSAECSIRLDDPSGRVSRRHAALAREGETWTMQDLGSTNGLRQNREDRRVFQLAPGDEIELGGITLIAESRRSVELHELLRRLLGWSAARLGEVDRALRMVREMANLRAALILRGEGPLHGVARRLHGVTLGDRPFVVLGGKERGEAGLDRAVNGMICVDARALPRDIHQVIAGFRMPDLRLRLMAFADSVSAAAEIATLIPRIATIWLPPLAERADELDRLLEAYGRDAVAELGAPDLGFRPHDLEWVRARGVKTLDEAEEVTHRLVALRSWGVAGGAKRLGITHSALSRWARRRKIPT
jgi:pSer/pThr/pTyr-binding forkhead associated (FHA) protein